VENIRELASGRVRFDVRLSRNQSERRVTVEAPVERRGRVRASNGEVETRIFVAVRLRIGPVEREVELSLVDRGRMIFRMLMRRRALPMHFWSIRAAATCCASRLRAQTSAPKPLAAKRARERSRAC